MEEGGKVNEAVREGESASHPFESGVVVAKRVDGGGLVEDVKVKVSEGRVVVELGFEEVEEVGGSEGLGEVGGEVVEVEVGVGVSKRVVFERVWCFNWVIVLYSECIEFKLFH